MSNRKSDRLAYFMLLSMIVAGVILVTLIIGLVSENRGCATEPKPAPVQQEQDWQQPYGGCDEAFRYPESQGAHECRDHGFDVTFDLATWSTP